MILLLTTNIIFKKIDFFYLLVVAHVGTIWILAHCCALCLLVHFPLVFLSHYSFCCGRIAKAFYIQYMNNLSVVYLFNHSFTPVWENQFPWNLEKGLESSNGRYWLVFKGILSSYLCYFFVSLLCTKNVILLFFLSLKIVKCI